MDQNLLNKVNEAIHCPERFKSATADQLPKELIGWLKQAKDSQSLFLYGPVGTGKTFALYALAKYFRIKGMKVKVRNTPDWFGILRQSFDMEDSEESLREQFREDGILMLDDIGTEKQTEWTQEILYRMINKRYELKLPTIFASNLDLDSIGKRYGDRIASRIVEMVDGPKGIIFIGGKDRRLK